MQSSCLLLSSAYRVLPLSIPNKVRSVSSTPLGDICLLELAWNVYLGCSTCVVSTPCLDAIKRIISSDYLWGLLVQSSHSRAALLSSWTAAVVACWLAGLPWRQSSMAPLFCATGAAESTEGWAC